MIATLALNTKAEFIKSKRTAAFWLTVVGALFVPLVNFISLMAKPEYFVNKLKDHPWEIITDENWRAASIFLMPMFVILVTSLVVQIEYKNNTWKQVYASPRSYADIFFSKLIVIHTLILCCFLLFNMSIVVFSWIAMLFNNGYHYFKQPIPWRQMLLLFGKAYFAVFSISVIQYWLSLRFRNFIVPMGIGLALLITGLIIHNWEHLYYYPYMYSAILCFKGFSGIPEMVQKAEINNIIVFVIVLSLAFLDTVKRRERG